MTGEDIVEIERKFLIDGFPEGLQELSRAEVCRGYLCVRPTVRIRRSRGAAGTDYRLCFKGEGTIARQEVELPLEPETFARLEELLEMPLVRKDYRVYALPDGLKLECSLVDEETPTAFYYAEVEFASLEEAYAFQPPPFLGREVTEERGYSMGEYWEKKRRLQG